MTSSVLRRITVVAPAQVGTRLRLRQMALAGATVFLVAAAGWYATNWWQTGRFTETTDDAYAGGNVTAVSPHVAGFVAELLVTDNQQVSAGQMLIQLDDRDFKAALDRATASVSSRRAALAALDAKLVLQQTVIRQAEANFAAKQAMAGFAKQDEFRYRALALTPGGTLQNAQRARATGDEAQANTEAAAAALAASRQQLNVLDAEIAEARAGVAQAEADLETARLDLGYTKIRAPIDGYIGNRAAQIGAYVKGGAYLLSVIPAQGLWVDANFKEDQLAHMRPGQPATVVADVLPGRVFHGHIESLAPGTGAVFAVIPPENATGNFTKIVQRVPVRIALDKDGARLGELRPGLSTTVSVDTKPADRGE
jgi:membrane fusion protein (multidrug efflux system)